MKKTLFVIIVIIMIILNLTGESDIAVSDLTANYKEVLVLNQKYKCLKLDQKISKNTAVLFESPNMDESTLLAFQIELPVGYTPQENIFYREINQKNYENIS